MPRSNHVMADSSRGGRCRRLDPAPLSPGVVKAVAVCLLAIAQGCGSAERHVVSGTVTVGGEPVSEGRVFFVPVEGVKGPRVAGEITAGQYRMETEGGLMPGKYRVELDAQKPTGRKVTRRVMGGETAEVDETVPIAPEIYRAAESPLVVEVPGATGTIDIAVPAA